MRSCAPVRKIWKRCSRQSRLSDVRGNGWAFEAGIAGRMSNARKRWTVSGIVGKRWRITRPRGDSESPAPLCPAKRVSFSPCGGSGALDLREQPLNLYDLVTHGR